MKTMRDKLRGGDAAKFSAQSKIGIYNNLWYFIIWQSLEEWAKPSNFQHHFVNDWKVLNFNEWKKERNYLLESY